MVLDIQALVPELKEKRWFEALETLPALSRSQKKASKKQEKQGMSLSDIEKIYLEEAEQFQKDAKRHSGGDGKWMKKVLDSGTASDRIAAMTLLIQDSPFHNLSSLNSLMLLAKKKERRLSLMALDSLKELFLNSLLPGRKLLKYEENPLHHPGATTPYQLLWYFEHQVKELYVAYVSLLEETSHDTVQNARFIACRIIHELLAAQPEQEKLLLSLLVNKLGDQDIKIASKVSYQLQTLLGQHPGMKPFLLQEVKNFLFRPNLSARAQFYGLLALNQMQFTKNDSVLATHLIHVYFQFFKVLNTRSEYDSRLVSAVLR
jgi:ribosome biogenesis protein MAK21